jgi:hypothetical protein
MGSTGDLAVRDAHEADYYRDIVRLDDQDLPSGIVRGCMVRITHETHSAVVHLRGNEAAGVILIDGSVRHKLRIHKSEVSKKKYQFEIRKAGNWDYLVFIWGASDPVYRIVNKLALIALVLAVVGLVPPMIEGLEKLHTLIWPK